MDKELSRDYVHVLRYDFSAHSAHMVTGAGVFHPSAQTGFFFPFCSSGPINFAFLPAELPMPGGRGRG